MERTYSFEVIVETRIKLYVESDKELTPEEVVKKRKEDGIDWNEISLKEIDKEDIEWALQNLNAEEVEVEEED